MTHVLENTAWDSDSGSAIELESDDELESDEDLEDEVDSARQSQNGNALPPEAEDTEASLLAREEILALCDFGALRASD